MTAALTILTVLGILTVPTLWGRRVRAATRGGVGQPTTYQRRTDR